MADIVPFICQNQKDIIGIITQLSPVTPLQGTVKRSVFIRNTELAPTLAY